MLYNKIAVYGISLMIDMMIEDAQEEKKQFR